MVDSVPKSPSLEATMRHEDEINRRLSETLGYEDIGSWPSRILMMDIEDAVEELKEMLELTEEEMAELEE
jgi:hypothetical protein